MKNLRFLDISYKVEYKLNWTRNNKTLFGITNTKQRLCYKGHKGLPPRPNDSNKKKNKWLITRLEPWSKYVFMAAEKGLLTNYKKSVLGLLGLVSRPSVPGWNFDLLTTVWKLQKFTFKLFWQKFRESNVFIKEYIKELISRNIFTLRGNFLFCKTLWSFLKLWPSYHNVEKREIHSHWKNISWNQIFRNFFGKHIAFTQVWSKKCDSKFP